jgi:hypothetical protein
VWVAEISREPGQVLNKKHLLDAEPSESDCHSTPALVVDGKGVLHIVAGSHAWMPQMQGFHYLHGIGDGIEQWSEKESLGMMQTYAGLAVDGADNLHLVYRRTPDLVYQRRDAETGKWAEPAGLTHFISGQSATAKPQPRETIFFSVRMAQCNASRPSFMVGAIFVHGLATPQCGALCRARLAVGTDSLT